MLPAVALAPPGHQPPPPCAATAPRTGTRSCRLPAPAPPAPLSFGLLRASWTILANKRDLGTVTHPASGGVTSVGPQVGFGDGGDGKVFYGHVWWLVPPQAGLVGLWDIEGLSPWWVTAGPALGEAGMEADMA